MAKQTKKNKSAPAARRELFLFTDPSAKRVELVGDFTDWQEQPIPMQRMAGGVWQTTVMLQSGEHHYRFLVDGEWKDDPACALHAPNPFGSRDAVRPVA